MQRWLFQLLAPRIGTFFILYRNNSDHTRLLAISRHDVPIIDRILEMVQKIWCNVVDICDPDARGQHPVCWSRRMMRARRSIQQY